MASDTSASGADGAAQQADSSDRAYAPDELGKGAPSAASSGASGAAAGASARASGGAPAGASSGADVNLDLILDVPVTLSLQVGSTQVPIRELVKFVEGSVIALDRDSREPMDVLVNGTLIAQGEIVLVDEQFGVRLTDVVSPVERIEKISK